MRKAANRYGVTPLSEAAASGNAAMIEALLNAGADPNTRTTADGETVLMTAARAGNVEAVKMLLSHGADVNAQGDLSRPDRADVGRRRASFRGREAAAGAWRRLESDLVRIARPTSQTERGFLRYADVARRLDGVLVSRRAKATSKPQR